MSFERPDACRLVFLCDACDDTHVFDGDEGGANRAPDFAAAWKQCQDEGWFAHRHRRAWDHFCPACAPTAQEEIEIKEKNDRERERIKERNARP